MATELAITTGADIPQDDAPPVDLGNGTDFDPQYPGSTPEAPYGFKANGEPYTRRPRGTAGGAKSGSKRMPTSEPMARSAAGLLARLNSLVALAIGTANMPATAAAMQANNEQFEAMAYEALLADPALCKKILGAGATSGKAGLVMAYSMLAVSIVPAARGEIMERKALREAEDNGDMR